jgi:hypothetical protein
MRGAFARRVPDAGTPLAVWRPQPTRKDEAMATTSNDRRMVTGIFRDRDSAEQAYRSVTERGYTGDDVNLVMSDETRKRYFADGAAVQTELGTKAAEGAGVGGAVGGTVGAIAGAIAAAGTSIAIPGLGLVIAGPIAAALAGAGAGAATGGVIGALVGAGIPEDRAMVYEKGLQEGGVVVGARARDEAQAAELERDFETYGGTSIRR